MTRQLMLEGFMVRPIVHVVDLEEGDSEPLNVGEYRVTKREMAGWLQNEWPANWDSLKLQLVANDAAMQQLKDTPKPPPRSVRRATAKKASPRKKAAS